MGGSSPQPAAAREHVNTIARSQPVALEVMDDGYHGPWRGEKPEGYDEGRSHMRMGCVGEEVPLGRKKGMSRQTPEPIGQSASVAQKAEQ